MDVDTRSSSFRNHRSGKQKRPRSPPSPNPYERPTKRQSIADAFAVTPFPQPLQPPPAMQDRQVSEDWVTRTRSLSIGKENMEHEMKLAPLVEMAVSGSQDENMNMDHDVPMHSSQSPSRSLSALPSIPSIPVYPSFSSLSSHSLSSTVAPSSSSSAFSHSTSPSMLPQAFSSPSALHDTHGHAFSSPQNHSQSSNVTQSPQCHMPPSAPIPARKQRFTMGPRADCEKCRLGVPGHWMHFD